MKFAYFFMLLAGVGAVHAQTTWDTSGNGMLKGPYNFRQVFYYSPDQYGDVNGLQTQYGTFTFDGNGNYSGTLTIYGPELGDIGAMTVTATGTYSIASSGYGFISYPCFQTGNYYLTECSHTPIFGLVSAQGIFVGSIGAVAAGNDMTIAAPVANPAPTEPSFTGSWTCADFDPTTGIPNYALGSLFTLNPDGDGTLNAGEITGYVGAGTSPITQSASALSYTFNNGIGVATFPAGPAIPIGNLLVAGQKYFYLSPDGNFLFGGSPTGFDMIVGVKTGTGTPALSGLYYQAGLDEAGQKVGGLLDSWLGAFNVIAGAGPQTVLGHRRITYRGGPYYASIGGSMTDYTYTDTISLAGNTFSNTSANYIVGDGGAVVITSGIGPNVGLSVALQAPMPTAASGVFLNPTGIVNAASNAPFTARIAPGELLTLYGSNLASSTLTAGIPFPTSGLGGVHVTIGGLPAAIYYVSPSQVSVIVPYGVTVGSVASIQVTNDMGSSNIVTNYMANTAPGVFTQNQNGTGYGEIEHLGIGNSVAPVGSVVSDASPAMPGETLAVYLTGLGAVSPAIADGASGPSGTLSYATNTIAVNFFGTAGTSDFAGLAPKYSGLYQLNVTVPAGLAAGPNFLNIAGPDSSMAYLLIPAAAPVASSGTAGVRPPLQ
jgi:uncharacterized protein (TIGR03437 family)